MTVEIDLNDCISQKLNINQYLLIKLLIEKTDIKSLSAVIRVDEMDISDLIERNILSSSSKLTEEYNNLFITKEYKEEIKREDPFNLFYDLYPIFVRRPEGNKDYLRENPVRCKLLYNKLVGRSKTKHRHILDCLLYVISYKTKTNKMMYFKKMAKWLTSEEWKLTEEMMKDDKAESTETHSYGTEIE